jgi:hypothetical protein
MDGLIPLFSAFGLAGAAGFNAYIPLLAVGLLDRYSGLLHLSGPFDILAHPIVLIVLGLLALVDFVADKMPAVDHVWHAIGLIIAPVAGAILFASQHNALSDLHPALAAIAGLVVAGVFHGGRAAVRPVATATTGGSMNPVLSLLEDVLSAGLSLFALAMPVLGFSLVVALAGALVWAALRARRLAARQRPPKA